MNARYYNPATARFLSQDTYTGSAFAPWTQHLYAYCNNNPVNMIDPTGHRSIYRHPRIWRVDRDDRSVTPSSPDPTPAPPTPTPIPGPQPGPSPEITAETHRNFDESSGSNLIDQISQLVNRLRNYINNTDEKVVLDAKNVAFYKGRLVVKHSIPGQTSCAIGGVIFLNRNEKSTNDNSIQAVRHEYGHTVQESILGFYKYVRYIAIPSLTHRDPTDYYSNPWELTADLFGGAQRPGGTSYYVDGAVTEALQYFVNAYDAKDFLPKPRYESFPLQYLFPQQ